MNILVFYVFGHTVHSSFSDPVHPWAHSLKHSFPSELCCPLTSALHNSLRNYRNQASQAQKPKAPCIMWWQWLTDAWQTAKPQDVLHESGTNTPPLCRYAFAHVSINAMWEVCVCVCAYCVRHVSVTKKSLASVHLSGAMGWWRWPNSRLKGWMMRWRM